VALEVSCLSGMCCAFRGGPTRRGAAFALAPGLLPSPQRDFVRVIPFLSAARKRTVLILVAVFLVLNLGWFICLQSMTDTIVRCTYGLPKLTGTSVAR
jgi:hypothetical protein